MQKRNKQFNEVFNALFDSKKWDTIEQFTEILTAKIYAKFGDDLGAQMITEFNNNKYKR